MKKALLLMISFCLLLSLGFASAENRIFAGAFNETAFEITPITPAHKSVEAYPGGDSDFYIKFYPSYKQYHVSEDNLDYESEIVYTPFYFITDVPENTYRIDFYYRNKLLKSIDAAEVISLNNFNITYNNSLVNFSWQTSLDNYYTSIYYDFNVMPILFESWSNNSYEVNMPLEWLNPEYQKFKLVISDGFNEKEAYFWFNVPYANWCNNSDFNHDGVVDAGDYITLKRNFGKSSATPAMGDTNNDGKVDFADLQIFQSNMGKSDCNQAIFPEIPAQLLAEANNELIVSESSSSSGSSKGKTTASIISKSKPSEAAITSNVAKEDTNTNKKQETPAKESKLSSLTKIIAKVIEIVKKAFISLLFQAKN